MSNLFRVKNGLNLSPVDLTTLTSPQAGDLACDINDSNKIKRYDANASAWTEVGSGGVGGTDILFVQDFESASLSSFTQTGLVLSQTNPLHGRVSALLTHQAAINQSFKQIIPVDRKFRGETMTLRLNAKSNAPAGDVTINIYDETNAANLVASEQLELSNDASGAISRVGFTIPESCASLSYTITALPEAGSPVTRIDDIICELAVTSLLETAVEVPNVTAWQGYTPTFQGFGTPTNVEFEWRQVGENVEIRGKFASGTPTAVEARVGLPGGLTSAGTSLIPSLSVTGKGTFNSPGASDLVALIEPSVTYLTFGVQNAGAAGLTKITGSWLLGASQSISFFASVPCAGLSATSAKTIPLTQSGLIQEADSRIYAASNAGQVITSVVTDIPFIFVSSSGSGITFTGSTFSVSESGIYAITGSTRQVTAGAQRIYLYRNGSYSRNLGYVASSSIVPFAGTLYLDAGVTYSLRFDATATLSADTAAHFLDIVRQGSLKQVSVITNQKATIPTSELRFEGASSRGSTATSIVRFDTQARLRGDAFSVVSDATNGTAITMLKAGKLNISSSVSQNTNQYLAISRNQAILTAFPSASETLSSAYINAASVQSVSWDGFVSVGDIIRIANNGVNPLASSQNNLNLSFQEQSVQVSVSNVLPQFSESDLVVRAAGNAGQAITANVTNIPFITISDTTGGAWNGSQFTVQESGLYNVTGTVYYTTTGQRRIFLTIDGTIGKIISSGPSDTVQKFDITENFSVGQVISIRSDAGTLLNSTTAHWLNITKVGKPNVTGVNVTPFVNVPQPVSQSSFLSPGGSFAGGATVTGALTSNTNDGLYSYNSTTGIYTILKDARINLSFAAAASGATSTAAIIYVNGSAVGQGYSLAIASTFASASYSGKLSVGSTFYFGIGNATSSAQQISVLATANADQILTAPETFSTDTASLQYASSAAYTLATLSSAPIGSYITFTYAANTNTRTQTTTRPTQTDADMNTNGILLYTRAYNAASTAAQPAAFAIQIGKGLKGKSLDLYKSAGKVTAGSLDIYYIGGNAFGASYKEYNELTGILTFDAGLVDSTNTGAHQFIFSDTTAQTSGYLVINASKNASLSGMNIERVSARAVNSAGTTFGTAPGAALVFDANKTFDTHGALNTSTGVFTAPEAGFYQVNAHVTFVTAAYTVNQGVVISGIKNGVAIGRGQIPRANGSVNLFMSPSYSDVVYLAKGDTFSINVVNERGATALFTDGTYNFFSITKTNIGGRN